jgi:hypothetical protein
MRIVWLSFHFQNADVIGVGDFLEPSPGRCVYTDRAAGPFVNARQRRKVHDMRTTSFTLIAAALAIGLHASLANAASSSVALNTVISRVELQAVPARDALEWLSLAAGFNVVVSWKTIEAQGIDPATPVTMRLRNVKAKTVLKLMLSEIFGDVEVVAEVKKQYVHIRTKEQADSDVVVRVYPIQDLLHEIPNFKEAPEFDLNQIASDTGSSGGGGSTIFEQDEENEEERLSRSQRANQIADLIRESIEPDIWRSNGGLHASIRYYNGNLIVSAPLYVHKKIGRPGVDSTPEPRRVAAPAAVRTTSMRTTSMPWYYGAYRYKAARMSDGVSGIDVSATLTH